ncbi:MAG: hypothetical protein IIW01_00030, partial [Thermoguttaceae bacterium]|nr:hypothetical protein [Thermoguttaceae bacterium]
MTPRTAFSFFLRPLRSRPSALGVGVLLATLASPLFASDATPQTPVVPPVPTTQTSTEPTRCVLTRLDVVYVGVVRDRGDVLSIELLDGGTVSVSKLDVQFVGGSRDDVFAFKKSRTRLEDVRETIRLADWANRRQLAPQGIALLEAKLAEPLSDGERRVVVAKLEELRQIEKLRASVAQTVAARQSVSTSAATPAPIAPEVAEIERWAKEVPVSAFERFARRAQPILQKRCATAGCHDGSNPNSAFRVRPKAVGTQARLALYFNMRETFDFIDFNNESSVSDLLTKTYRLSDLQNYFGEIPQVEAHMYDSTNHKEPLKIGAVQQSFPIECIRRTEAPYPTYYAIYRVAEG